MDNQSHNPSVVTGPEGHQHAVCYVFTSFGNSHTHPLEGSQLAQFRDKSIQGAHEPIGSRYSPSKQASYPLTHVYIVRNIITIILLINVVVKK